MYVNPSMHDISVSFKSYFLKNSSKIFSFLI
jgi:hypothetical protein